MCRNHGKTQQAIGFWNLPPEAAGGPEVEGAPGKTLPTPTEATRTQLTDLSLPPQGRAKDLKLNGKSPVECTLVHVTLHFTTKPERVTLQI